MIQPIHKIHRTKGYLQDTTSWAVDFPRSLRALCKQLPMELAVSFYTIVSYVVLLRLPVLQF